MDKKRYLLLENFMINCMEEDGVHGILFDADKIDLTGAIGMARTLMYKGTFSEPVYIRKPDGTISDGERDTEPSFFQEYKYRLEKIPSLLYTKKARELAAKRKEIAEAFYKNLYQEVSESVTVQPALCTSCTDLAER